MARISSEELRARLQASVVVVGNAGDYQALMNDMSDLRPTEVSQAVKQAEQEGALTLIVATTGDGKPVLRYEWKGS